MTILKIGNNYYGIRDTGYGERYPIPITHSPTNRIHYPLPFTRHPKRGFSFLEVMVAVAVLSFGIVMIFQAFLTSLNAFSYYLTHLQVQCLANEKIWEVSDRLMRRDLLGSEETSGNFIVDNKNIAWNVDVNPIGGKEEFFNLSLILSWQEGKRKIKVQRDAYAGM